MNTHDSTNTIGPTTTVHDLLERYPFLLDFLAGYHPKFALLRNAAARAAMGRVATLERAAAIAGLPLDTLLRDIAGRIEQGDGGTVPRASGPDPARLDALKRIIRSLHDGAAPDSAREAFSSLIRDVDPAEIAAMEEALIRDGLPVSEIHRLCDLHVGIFRESLDRAAELSVPPGHPLAAYLAENQALARAADRFVDLVRRAASEPFFSLAAELRAALDDLATVERHYARKENQLFPALERHGFSGPSQVMWSLHDDVRRMLKGLRAAIEAGDAAALSASAPEAARAVVEMIYKEEKILFPTALQLLSDDEWRRIRAGDDEIGYALIPPPPPWPADAAAPASAESPSVTPSGRLRLHTGELTLQQIDRMLLALPVEISFVDDTDEVRYYSGHNERIFPRSPGVIGRKVQNCHPPKSVHMVNAILAAFRNGTRDVAEFWIPFKDKFLLITYHAVRDEHGRYLGALEVTQDITRIRTLTGERRLLQWEP